LTGLERDTPRQVKTISVTGFNLKYFAARKLCVDQPASLQMPQRVRTKRVSQGNARHLGGRVRLSGIGPAFATVHRQMFGDRWIRRRFCCRQQTEATGKDPMPNRYFYKNA
jgi:hypothetical protein